MAPPAPQYTVRWAHSDRHRQRRDTDGPPHAIVLHTSEQMFPTTGTAESLASAIAGPKTPIPGTNPVKYNVASYHWCDDLDSIVHMVRVLDVDGRDDIAHHAPPNWHGEAICLTGRAARDWTGTDDNNDSDPRDVDDWPQLRLTAKLTAWRLFRRGWPPVKLTVPEFQAGKRGVCDHHTVSLAFKLTDHTDVGLGFPWLWFMEEVRRHLATPDDLEDEMLKRVVAVRQSTGWEAELAMEMTGFPDTAARDGFMRTHQDAKKVVLSDADYDTLARVFLAL